MVEMVHLHVHTDASRIDGLGPVGRLVEAAKLGGFEALAMTDHGSLANAIAFTLACQAADIKPLLGMEGYVAVDGKVGHITLLADGNSGFHSLVELNNLGQASRYQRPAFELDDLLRNSTDLICLSGCIASPLQSMEYNEARQLALRLKDAFGSRFFAEAMFVSETPTWERTAKLSRDLRIPLVTTNDVHFPYPEDAPVHTVLTNLKASFSYESKLLYLATPKQIEQRLLDRKSEDGLRAAQVGMMNSVMLARQLRPVTFSSTPSLPTIDKATLKLSNEVDEACLEVGGDEELAARAYRELEIIDRMGYSAYFLILNDIVQFAKSKGVRVGPGRGSGAGSAVLYLLGVTDINPLDYDLSFERFLNPKRKGMPDVDLDFDSDGRQLVIDYARTKWGAWPVATYSRYSHKMLVHDLAKHLRLPRDIEEEAADEGPESEAFKTLCDRSALFAQAYQVMDGQIRHIGQHAGGIVITDADVPLERTSDGQLVAAWTEGETKELSAAGIVKYDILGLSALSILKELEDKKGRRAEDPVINDPVFSIFRSGNLSGIFQFSGSHGIVDFTRKVEPRCFEDLIAINALYRPGALDAGTAWRYPEWRRAPRLLHPLIDPILAETYGVIVYQEQMMSIFAALAGGDLGDADLARRVITKMKHSDPSWEAEMAELKLKLLEGAKKQGVKPKLAERIWSELATHTRYSFNKSHATAYARVAWEMAWWKFHFPADFFTALLNHDPDHKQAFLFEAIEVGLTIAPPHVNRSDFKYRLDSASTTIRLPLSAVKFLGGSGVQAIVEAQPFSSIEDFMARVPKAAVKSNARLGLWQLGAFEGLAGKWEDLKIKGSKLTTGSETAHQHQHLGFIIPPKSVIDRLQEHRKHGLLAGIVTEVVDKESSYGKYSVYHLAPSGAAWSREFKLKEGFFVALKVKADSGKILRVEEQTYVG